MKHQVFPVYVLKTKIVGDLKDQIKEKKSRHFERIDASDLVLGRVSLPLDDNFEENIRNVDLVPLNPLLSLSEVFPHVDRNLVHILVTNSKLQSFFTFQVHSCHQTDRLPRTQEKRTKGII